MINSTSLKVGAVDVIIQIRQEVGLVLRVCEHLYTDLEASVERQLIYNFDYNLVYPYLWPDAKKSDRFHDNVGANFFSIYPLYSNMIGFDVVFTTPSLLELLDSIDHHVEKYDSVAGSKDHIRRVYESFSHLREKKFEIIDSQTQNIRDYLLSLRITGLNNRLNQFIELLRTKRIKLIDDFYTDDQYNHVIGDISKDYASAFDEMCRQRGPKDPRPRADREFHYRVDAWNIAISRLNQTSNSLELNHICNGRIREFYAGKRGQIYSRHPLVPMYRLLSLMRASSSGELQREAKAFLRDAIRQMSECLRVVNEIPNLQVLSEYDKEKIDEVYNKFIRPLFRDYTKGGAMISFEEVGRMMQELHDTKFKSILTERGFADRFKQEASDLRDVAKRVIELKPEILGGRLIEDYITKDNPRIKNIMSRLNRSS